MHAIIFEMAGLVNDSDDEEIGAEEVVLLAYASGILDDDQFAEILAALERPPRERRTPDYQHQNYESFDLDRLTEDECWTRYRFRKADIPRIVAALLLGPEIVTYDRHVVPSVEAFCVLLRRFAFPIRLSDLVPEFARPVPTIGIIVSHMVRYIHSTFGHLLDSIDQTWLSRDNLKEMATAVTRKHAVLQNCWGFLDGTGREICRPGEDQEAYYNGHKRKHVLKYQSLVAANGMYAHFYGPIVGRHHDSTLLTESGLLGQLESFSFAPDGSDLCIFGDAAYPISNHLQTPFKGTGNSDEEVAFNSSMSSVRITVEWGFKEITTYFAAHDFKKNIGKVMLSPVGKYYLVCAFLQNLRTILYGNQTSAYFGMDPPTLDEYLSG